MGMLAAISFTSLGVVVAGELASPALFSMG
jgi:hypothetical protein